MEQTSNTFLKGLQKDTHPMVQGNDTLTNALNATLITMKGNEVVLLNDMGNRRVDEAYLPAGYEPVGIKEYGGIIYIASYNPITNKSLIGSFPSPQMKYGKYGEEINSIIDLKIFKDDFFIDTKSGFTSNVKFQKTFAILSPFVDTTNNKNIILHTGDKFVIYGKIDNEEKIFSYEPSPTPEEEEKMTETEKQQLLNRYKPKDLLTHYENVTFVEKEKEKDKYDYYITSPKNKKYTLYIGVLNSLNEFVDCTEKLSRWNTQGYELGEQPSIIKFDENVQSYIKENAGYFIPLTLPHDLSLTIADDIFNKNRLIKADTFSSKISGPLYMKLELNVIQNLTYNVSSQIVGKNRELVLDLYYIYNCPDFISTDNFIKDGDDKYYTYEEYKKPTKKANEPAESRPIYWGDVSNSEELDKLPTYYLGSYAYAEVLKSDTEKSNEKFVQFDKINKNDPNNELLKFEIKDEVIEDSEYIPKLNMYKIHKRLITENLEAEELDKVILEIVPLTTYGLGIRNLSFVNVIDMSKLKTNEIKLTTFNFKYEKDNRTLTIRWGFTGYSGGNSFELGFRIYEYVSEESFKTLTKKTWPNGIGINGCIESEIEIEEPNESEILLVKFYYKEQGIEQGSEQDNSSEELIAYRWVMTTKLFNDLYNSNIINDYQKKYQNGRYHPRVEELLEIKPTIKIDDVESNITYETFKSEKELFDSTGFIGKLQIVYGLKAKPVITGNINISINGDKYPIKSLDEIEYNIYPGFLDIKYSKNDVNTMIVDVDSSNTYKSELNKASGTECFIDKITVNGNTYETNINNFTRTRITDNKYKFEYKPEFLLCEYVDGEYKKVDNVLVGALFKSIYSTYLEKLKNLKCVVILPYAHPNDRISDNLIIISYLDGNDEFKKGEYNWNILNHNGKTYDFSGGRFYGSNNYELLKDAYKNQIGPWIIDKDKEEFSLDDDNFEYMTKLINTVVGKDTLFIIGTCDSHVYTNFCKNDTTGRLNQISTWEQNSPLRPILFFMRIGNNRWAILPPKNLFEELNKENLLTVNSGNGLIILNNNALQDMGKKSISKEKLLKLGYLFEFDEVDDDKKLKYGEWKYIKEYLKSRIKDFYFLYKKSANIGDYNVNLSVINKENSEVNYLNDTESFKIDYKIKLDTKFKENIYFKNKLELDEDSNLFRNGSLIEYLIVEDTEIKFNPFENKKDLQNFNNQYYIPYLLEEEVYVNNSEEVDHYNYTKLDDEDINDNSILIKNNDKYEKINLGVRILNLISNEEDKTYYPIISIDGNSNKYDGNNDRITYLVLSNDDEDFTVSTMLDFSNYYTIPDKLLKEDELQHSGPRPRPDDE